MASSPTYYVVKRERVTSSFIAYFLLVSRKEDIAKDAQRLYKRDWLDRLTWVTKLKAPPWMVREAEEQAKGI